MKHISWRKLVFRVAAAGVFAAAFLAFTEIGRGSLAAFTGGRSDCCERCRAYLFDTAQPVLAICAAISFFIYSFLESKTAGVKYFAKTIGVCWVSFQVYTAWTAWHLLMRTPCTALYSPGPLLIVGVFFVVAVLLIESTVWAALCALPIVLISIVRKLVAREETLEFSLK